MKKLFTTIMLMGVALCGWATITETSDGDTVTLNYVDDGNSNDQNFNLSNTNATTIVLTGDWANKNLQKIGTIVGQCSGNVFLDMSACEGFISKIETTDWTSENYTFTPNASNPITVQRSGTATKNMKYYNDWALDSNGQPQSWATPYTGEVIDNNGSYTTSDGQPLVAFPIFVDENGKEVPSSSVTENPDGTYSYSFTETLDSTPFSFAGNDFSNNAGKLSGIAFPNSGNFTAIPDFLFGQDGPQNFTNVTLGSSLMYIGKSAFKNSKITSVVFPAGLKAIGGEAFHGAPITGINLAECTSLVAIKYEAFEECANATTVTFPGGSNLTFIGNDAFHKSGITSVEMSQCTGITEFQSKNNDGTTFKTFANCTSLTYVSLPPKLTAVPADGGNGLFKGSINIEEVKFNGIPRYVDCELQNPCTIGDDAFHFAQTASDDPDEIVLNKLAKITLSKNITSIGEAAFHSAAITEIHIPASVEELKKHSFYGCQNLITVYFDEFDKDCGDCDGAATKVAGAEGDGGQGQGAFEECQHITDVYINTMAELQCDNNAFDQDISWGAGDAGANFATLHYKKEKIEHYVNLKHYLTDDIVTNAGLFHEWLEDHYKQAIIPHKNGWYEFINSGPTIPNDGPEYQDIILRTFSDYDYAYLVPQGIRAYVVNNIEKVGDNYEVSLMRLNVIPKRTGVILYGHPNGKTQDGKPSLVFTPVKFLEDGDSVFKIENGVQVLDSIYHGRSNGMALTRANWKYLDDDHMMYKNYLMPLVSEDGSRVHIEPYDTIHVNGKAKTTFRNFGLGRYTSTDYYKKDSLSLSSDENNYVGFFRMKRLDYNSGYAYLQLRGAVDEEGHSLPYTNQEGEEFVSELPVATSGEILVKPDEPAETEANKKLGIYPYTWEVMIKNGIPYDAAKCVGDSTFNPKRWWDKNAKPVGFYWREYKLSWGDRTLQFGNAPNPAAQYFGELEENADGIVKVVIPADAITNDEYYTLQGIKVTKPRNGVYIHNGKKVILK